MYDLMHQYLNQCVPDVGLMVAPAEPSAPPPAGLGVITAYSVCCRGSGGIPDRVDLRGSRVVLALEDQRYAGRCSVRGRLLTTS